MWQRYWDLRSRDFLLVAVAQDVQGERRVRPIVEQWDIDFPVLVDATSELARALRFRIVPSGAFVDETGIVRYRHVDDFDIADPRVKANLDSFLSGRGLELREQHEEMSSGALELFARGVSSYEEGRRDEALALWRRALDLDADNFLIRSQIWAVENPSHFYPVVDREWQSLQLLKEGYDKPLP